MKGSKAFSAIPTVLFLTIPVCCIGFLTLSPSKTGKLVYAPTYKPTPRFSFTPPSGLVSFHLSNPPATSHHTSLSFSVFACKMAQTAILLQEGYRSMDVSLLTKQIV